MSKTFLIAFLELLFLDNCVMLGGAFGEHYPIYQVVLGCSFFSLLPIWAVCEKGHHY
jgi:hypothetical protein